MLDLPEENVVVPPREFWERKVDKYIQLWEYGHCTNEQFQKNMVRMGYDEDIVTDIMEE